MKPRFFAGQEAPAASAALLSPTPSAPVRGPPSQSGFHPAARRYGHESGKDRDPTMNTCQLEVIWSSGQKRVAFTPPMLLSRLLAENGVPLDMPCGGRQRCLKCKVTAQGRLSPLSAREQALLTPEEQAAGVRYACMAELLGDARVRLPEARPASDRIVTDGTLPAFEPQPWGQGLGVAVDIGTTTVAAYLYDLKTGGLLATQSEKNPQAVFGADVISRLEKSLAGQRDALAEAIRDCIRRLALALCADAGARPEQVDSAVLTGNTAMLYLLCGRDPSSITAAPFQQDCFFGFFLSPADLSLPLGENCRIFLPRCLSAYVGADITTALMAAEFYKDGLVRADHPRLLVDIGTNGEMALAAEGRLLCCSTAAGPAFEGAGIHQGMMAKTGAIHKVSYEDGRILCQVLGDGPATGICGSGLVDAIAVLRRAGVIDETGIINEEDHPFTAWVTEVEDQPGFRLPGTEVVLTQKDVRAVQLAKSAICAGMMTLMEEAGMPPEQVEELVIAGGFGSKIDVASAEAIGLIPAGFAAKSKAIGNAAGAGAAMVLLSAPIREDTQRMGEATRTVELSTSPTFMDAYIDGMLFP